MLETQTDERDLNDYNQGENNESIDDPKEMLKPNKSKDKNDTLDSKFNLEKMVN